VDSLLRYEPEYGRAVSATDVSGRAPAGPNGSPDVTETLGHGDRRTVFRMAWPAIVENSLHTLLGIVDTIIVGQFGAVALAAVGAGIQWLFLSLSILFGLMMGAIVLVAWAIGAGDPESAARAARQSMLLAGGLGVLYLVLGVLGAEGAVRILGADEQVVAVGGRFLRIISYCAVLTTLTIGASSLLRAAGDTRTPMISTAVANVVNAVAAYLLVFGVAGLPQMGVDGSGWGTNIARAVGFAIVIRAIARHPVLRVTLFGDWRPVDRVIRRIIDFGSPAVLEQVLMMGSFMVYAVIALQLGTTTFAAQRVTFNALTISILPAFGFAIAVTTLCGQYLGAGRHDLADRSTWVGVQLAAGGCRRWE